MNDYAEPLLAARKALATMEAAAMNGLWVEYMGAVYDLQGALYRLESYGYEKVSE